MIMTTKRETGKTRTKRYREPLPPMVWLILLLAIAWIIVELCLLGFAYVTGAKGPFEERYAGAEEWLWSKPMPLLVTYGRKEVEVEHVVEKWRFVMSSGGWTQSGGTVHEFREPTAEEGEKSPKLRGAGERVTVFFPVEPETMRVYRWEAGKEKEKTELTLENGALSLVPGKWIYGVEASWPRRVCEGGSWYGQAWYCFRASGPAK